jgi:nitrite reductase/ring-hydroxylating ferredoxin subunit
LITNIIKDFLLNSKCVTEKQQREFLHKLLGNKQLVTILLYSGSIHGWMAKDFHSRCDNKGPTISLFKIKDGDCVGGYTTASWSFKNKWLGDSEAMLFNLTCCRHFPT